MTPSPSISQEHQSLLENASWLQRLAESLVRDPHHADDLAQQTIEAALGRTPPQAAQHRPWLARILRNKVYANHRQDSRRVAREQRVMRSEWGSIPNDAVERAEIGKRLTESIMHLEEPFRTTLLLRFHEDQSPKEIARKLGVPASTVRSRIQRGLEKLREDIGRSWGKDWQKCYPAVLAFSRAGVSSGLKAGSLLLPIAIIIGVASTLMVVKPWQGKESTQAVALVTETERMSANVEGFLAKSEIEVAAIQRVDLSGASSVGIPITVDPIILKGRVIAKETGEPLAGCKVTFFGDLSTSSEVIFHDGPEWVNPPPIVTTENGSFEFSVVDPHPNLNLYMNLKAEGRISWRGEWGIRRGNLKSTDLGDVQMEKGVKLRGKVVHEDGTLMPQARILFDDILGQSLTDPNGGAYVSGHADEQGEFTLNTALPPGSRNCRVRVKNHLLVGPKFVVVKEGVGEQFVTFTVKSMPFIEGIVTHADGTPAANIHLMANIRGGKWSATDNTDVDGNFRIYSTTEVAKPFNITLSGKGIQNATTTQEFEWGLRDIHLTAAKSLSAQIVVLQKKNHEPLEGFTIEYLLLNEFGTYNSWGDNQIHGQHANGLVHLTGLNPGTYQITITPRDPKWRMAKAVQLHLPFEEDQPVEIFMQQGRSVKVQVMDSNANPIMDSTVVFGDSFPLMEQQAKRMRPKGLALEKRPTVEGLHQVAIAVTNEDGIAEAFLPTDYEGGGLNVLGAHLTKTAPIVAAQLAAGQVNVVVQLQSKVQGTLLYPASMKGEVALFFAKKDPIHLHIGVRQEDLVIPNGNGEYKHFLNPGNYEAFLMVPNPTSSSFQMGSGWAQLYPPLGEFHLAEDSDIEMNWDATNFAPGSLTGRILIDGVPQKNAEFRLHSQGLNKDGIRTDADGYFHFDGLPANTYFVYFRLTGDNTPWPWSLTSEKGAQVLSGMEIKQDFDFRYRTLRIRPLHPETGEPFRNVDWRFSFASRETMTSDADGWIEITPAPHKPMHLSHRSNDVSYLVRDIQMDVDKMEQSITVTATYPIPR